MLSVLLKAVVPMIAVAVKEPHHPETDAAAHPRHQKVLMRRVQNRRDLDFQDLVEGQKSMQTNRDAAINHDGESLIALPDSPEAWLETLKAPTEALSEYVMKYGGEVRENLANSSTCAEYSCPSCWLPDANLAGTQCPGGVLSACNR